LSLGVHGRDLELQVIRGELRAQRRCPAAVSDFTQVLAAAPAAPLAERALRGRAACHLRSGDPERAAADLSRYLRQFPNGRFAAEARAALKQH
jgi:regulator of sirC expression with transglutaminase-like and TPR domain